MKVTKIISAIGNNDSIFPLLIRDCGVENPVKCALTYRQNKDDKFIRKQATREKAIDEYGASAIWLGGIPLISKIYDKFIDSRGFNSKISYKLFKEENAQGLKKNIEKFKDLAPKEVQDLIKVEKNKKAFKNLQIGKLLATTIIPIALMGFILPKANYALTKRKIKEEKRKEDIKTTLKTPNIEEFKANSSKTLSFKGSTPAFDILNISDIQKMMITDVGLGAGRVSTERSKRAKTEKFIGAIGAFALNYLTPKKIDKGLNSLTQKIFKIDSSLDPNILSNEEFKNSIKRGSLKLPEKLDNKSLLDFVDQNPKETFTKIAQEQKIVSFLKTGLRDPRKYVEMEKLKELNENLDTFSKNALQSGNVDGYFKKALSAKTFNIFANIGLSSFLLAYALPKVLFIFRNLTQKDKLDPGIKSQID